MEDDLGRRTYFCEQMLDMLDNSIIQLKDVMFSDECSLSLNGHANRQNCRNWSTKKPHWIREEHTPYPQKINVWAGIVGNHIKGYLNDNYYVIPSLINSYPDPGNPQVPVNTIWFE